MPRDGEGGAAGLGVWNVVHRAASPGAWTAYPAGATHWSTVTPLVYDVHPKSSDQAGLHHELASMVARACEYVGLGEPREVFATQVSAHVGTPPAHAFPRILRKDGGERRHTHVIITFDRPVTGPVILGAGRYRGYGLFRPLRYHGATPLTHIARGSDETSAPGDRCSRCSRVEVEARYEVHSLFDRR